MRPLNLLGFVTPFAFVASIGSSAVAAPPALPEPGWYRIDSEMTRSSANSPIVSITRTDGATGTVTSTQTMRGTNQTTTSVTPGTGPNYFCSQRGAPPPTTANCNARLTEPGTIVSRCATLDQQDQWTRLDADRWQRTLHVQQGGGAGAVAAPAATASAMAPVLAALESRANSGTPEEQAAIRQQLAMLKQSMAGAGPAATATFYEVRETWTRESGSCPTGK